jgi:hypothetical protein
MPKIMLARKFVPCVRIVRIELVPHRGIAHPKAIAADFKMRNGVLAPDMRTPLAEYALRQWSVDCSDEHRLEPKENHLWLNNPQTLFGAESAALAPDYSAIQRGAF